ncbi:MAG: replicative DNA helicase [Spirulina sp. DLM2.Bin59]|nr:MAG: replicative DNA helicase [Spirulina sp. DLM2.Bin59]
MAEDFTSFSDALPPQNLEAEESILGGILLDPEAMGRVADLLKPEAFYDSTHRILYQGALALHRQGKPTDLMTVTSWLQDQGVLEKVGGTAKLAQLVDRTVSAVNIDRYALLIMEKYVRRQLIGVSYEIAELGYDTTLELEQVLDRSEQKVFNLTQERPQEGLVHISESLIEAFTTIENQQDNTAMPGLSCGFYDLDAMTSGFQRSDLIIIAARPSMGKCLSRDTEIVLADGSIQTLEEIYHNQRAELLTLGEDWRFHWTQPSVYVDDGVKPVFEVKTRTGRRIETTLSHPFLTIQGWRSLQNLTVGEKIAVPRHLPVFGTGEIPVEQVKLLAYFIGDGCLTQASPQFTNTNPTIQEDFKTAALTFPGVKIRFSNSKGKRAATFYVTSDLEKLKAERQIFAEKFKFYLKQFNYSDCALAQILEVSPALIALWKQGKCAPNIEIFTKLCQLLNVSVEDLAPGGLATIRWQSQNTVTLWLKSLDLLGKSAHNKNIPAVIFTLKKSQVALFLNRLFATDGWATVLKSGQSQVGYASVSETLARQVQHLLLRFGIIARLKARSVRYQDHRRPAWQLDITDSDSLQIFMDQIGILGKEAALAKIAIALSQRRKQTNCDLIPVEIWEAITIAKGQESWKSLATRAEFQCTSNIHVGKRAPSRQRLLALATALEDPELRAIATSDVYWDEIVAITPQGNKQVYDLTIPNDHNFVANDICVHNTSFALNVASNIAKSHQLPVAIFSLEMSKEQLSQRLLASEAGVESNRIRSGHLTTMEMEKIAVAIGTLSELPIYIDDSVSLTVMQMRSQVRRLQAEQKGKIGAVLIDYLQLMEGGSDNRVQELSKITRSLKGLAREVNAPVLALSQLSRGVESRTNKRPMMSDLRESGCLAGDTLIPMVTGELVPIRELVGRQGFQVWALDESNLKLVAAPVSHSFCTGVKPVFALKTRLGRCIQATANHQFRTLTGWVRLDQLKVGDRLAIPCISPQPKPINQIRGDQGRIAMVLDPVPLKQLEASDLYWDEIVEIMPCGETDVYDLTVPQYHNFIANNIVVHNSIEQDADVILMLYRDAYYNPDSPDRNVAEAIIVKHRNGPTGTVRLLFQPELTKFENLARE